MDCGDGFTKGRWADVRRPDEGLAAGCSNNGSRYACLSRAHALFYPLSSLPLLGCDKDALKALGGGKVEGAGWRCPGTVKWGGKHREKRETRVFVPGVHAGRALIRKMGVARHLHAGASDPSELSKSWRFWEIGRSKLQHSRIAVRQGRADVSDA